MRAPFLPVIAIGLSLVIGGSANAADVMTLIKNKQASPDASVPMPKTVPFTYIVDMDIDGAEGDDATAFQIRYRVDPAAEPGKRVTLLSGDISDYDEDVQKELTKFDTESTAADIAEEFWCVGANDDTNISPEDITVISENESEAVLSLNAAAIKSMMESDEDDDMPGKVKKRMAGEMTVAKPDLQLRHMKLWLTKPTTVKIVAKIKEMNIEQRCDTAPNGLPYVSERKMKVSGKALGSSFRQDMVIRVSELKPL